MAAADADVSHTRLPKQDTCGSGALCLGAPSGRGKPTIELPAESEALKAANEVFARLLGKESLKTRARLAS